jgi:hypothetical protein
MSRYLQSPKRLSQKVQKREPQVCKHCGFHFEQHRSWVYNLIRGEDDVKDRELSHEITGLTMGRFHVQGILPTVLQYSHFRKLNESEHAEERLHYPKLYVGGYNYSHF